MLLRQTHETEKNVYCIIGLFLVHVVMFGHFLFVQLPDLSGLVMRVWASF